MVTRAQLVVAGIGRSAIARALADGRLVSLHRGVYAVGHAALRREAEWLAAVLACGEGAVLSHRSAAAAWEMGADDGERVHVTVVGNGGRRQATLAAHRCRLDAADSTCRWGLAITTPARTLLDLAEVVPRDELARATERCVLARRFDPRAMEAVISRGAGRRGLRALRAVLAELELLGGPTRSELERRALRMLRSRGLPRPAVNAMVGPYEVDLLWPEQRLVVELDGFAFHASPVAFERDRRRDADLQARGFRVLRFTWRQVTREPAWVAARISSLLDRGVGARPR